MLARIVCKDTGSDDLSWVVGERITVAIEPRRLSHINRLRRWRTVCYAPSTAGPLSSLPSMSRQMTIEMSGAVALRSPAENRHRHHRDRDRGWSEDHDPSPHWCPRFRTASGRADLCGSGWKGSVWARVVVAKSAELRVAKERCAAVRVGGAGADATLVHASPAGAGQRGFAT